MVTDQSNKKTAKFAMTIKNYSQVLGEHNVLGDECPNGPLAYGSQLWDNIQGL